MNDVDLARQLAADGFTASAIAEKFEVDEGTVRSWLDGHARRLSPRDLERVADHVPSIRGLDDPEAVAIFARRVAHVLRASDRSDGHRGEAHHRARHSAETVATAITLVESGASRAAVARQLGVSRTTLSDWVTRRTRGDG